MRQFLHGRVKFWSVEKRFGFITPDDPSQEETYCHSSSLCCEDELKQGAEVLYMVEWDAKKGKYATFNVLRKDPSQFDGIACASGTGVRPGASAPMLGGRPPVSDGGFRRQNSGDGDANGRESWGGSSGHQQGWGDHGGDRKGKGSGKGEFEMKPGDWSCAQCGFMNFARNVDCRKCGAPKPADAGSRLAFSSRQKGSEQTEQGLNGDWAGWSESWGSSGADANSGADSQLSWGGSAGSAPHEDWAGSNGATHDDGMGGDGAPADTTSDAKPPEDAPLAAGPVVGQGGLSKATSKAVPPILPVSSKASGMSSAAAAAATAKAAPAADVFGAAAADPEAADDDTMPPGISKASSPAGAGLASVGPLAATAKAPGISKAAGPSGTGPLAAGPLPALPRPLGAAPLATSKAVGTTAFSLPDEEGPPAVVGKAAVPQKGKDPKGLGKMGGKSCKGKGVKKGWGDSWGGGGWGPY